MTSFYSIAPDFVSTKRLRLPVFALVRIQAKSTVMKFELLMFKLLQNRINFVFTRFVISTIAKVHVLSPWFQIACANE